MAIGYRPAAAAAYRYCASVRYVCNVYSIHPTNEKTIMEYIKPRNETTIIPNVTRWSAMIIMIFLSVLYRCGDIEHER